MAAPDVGYSDENTALNSSKNKSNSTVKQRYGTTASSFDSVEGLTPSGYEVNPCQLSMICCWMTVGIIPHLAALIVGFEHADITCNDYDNYGWIHPRGYLKTTGIMGIIVSIIGTLAIYYFMSYNEAPLEMIVNGKLLEFQHPSHPYPEENEENDNGNEDNMNVRKHKYSMVINKLVAYSIIIASFIWDIIGWSLVSKLNYNGCSDELVTQTILAWTILNMLLLICALSSRFVKRSKQINDSEADFGDQEEGSIDHKV